MIYLGLDPGTAENMAIAALLPAGHDHFLRVRIVDGGLERFAQDRAGGVSYRLRRALTSLCLPLGHSCSLALEWQRPLESDRNPKNICDLSAFAGIALGTIQTALDVSLQFTRTPNPEQWKGQVPKHVMHNRIVARAGLPAVREALERGHIRMPKDLGAFRKEFTGAAGNAIDAIGLALWMQEKDRLSELIASGRVRSS